MPPEAAGTRLDRFVVGWVTEAAAETDEPELPALSRAQIQRLIAAGRVTVDDQPCRASRTLRGGEQVRLELPPPEPLDLVPEPMDLRVLFEDQHLIALDKPAGLVVHPGPGHHSGTLVHGLLAHCRDLSGIGGVSRPGIVHRLDRGTSGVLVVAKSDRAHEGLAAQFAGRTAHKTYVAFVVGEPQPRADTIDTPFGRHPTDRKRFSGRVSSGRRAITHYRVRAARGGLAELEIDLATGRTHQIRVHLAERGHPVAGDAPYGGRKLARVVDAPLHAACAALDHQALHAARLEIAHPVTSRRLVLEAPLPADLAELRRLIAAND